MDILEMFALLVEVSIALAGFAGIIATFQYGGEIMVRRGPVAALTVIVQLSLLTALLASLPLLFHTFGLRDEDLWGTCSAIGVPLGFGIMYSIDSKMRPALSKRRFWLIYGTVQTISLLLVIGLFLNTVNIIFHREPGPYMLAGVFLPCFAGYMFFRLLLNPLWKRVRDGERGGAS
jgi:hypothetical protein